MPPLCRNHRVPTAGEIPAATPASSLVRPLAIAAQKRCLSSRLATGGRPGDCIRARSARSERRRLGSCIRTPDAALRRPLEPGQYVSIRYTERLAEAGAVCSVGSRGDSYDNPLAEAVNGLACLWRRGGSAAAACLFGGAVR